MAFSDSLKNLVRIIAVPGRAFSDLREKPTVWFPLLLIVIAWIVLWNWYYGAVNYPWLVDHMIATETAKAPPEQHTGIKEGIRNLKPGGLVILSSIFVGFMLTCVSLLTAGYLNVVSAIVDDKYRFRNWFSLVLWCNVPSLFTMLAMVAHFYTIPDARIPPENLNPLSLKSLLGVSDSNPYRTLLETIDLTSFWTWALLVVGYRQWTKRGWVQSVLSPLVPAMGIYATWALIVWL